MKNKIAREVEPWRGVHQVEAGPEEKEEKEEKEQQEEKEEREEREVNCGDGGNDCSVHTRSALE